MTGLRLPLLIVVAAVLEGCAGSYGCPGQPDNPICLSAVDAYHATEKTPTRRAGSPPLPAPPGAATTASTARTPTRAAISAPQPRLDDPAPLRTPAKVMRIWIAPWEDADGDLQVSGYVYTELAARRWLIGEPAAPLTPTLRPLQVVPRKHPAESAGDRLEPGPSRFPPAPTPGGPATDRDADDD
jgi:conjugal transfer pilus assembly protein TraV